ncbi:hypothetical protein [Plantactinospora soyae]|uniref:Uncharacterized protein n=1 Tax=Plantactinospora soyae TaxID=1544732 RepID=A0A927R9F9_9ACTN|nr:hypothetical protein [Plantactinospora soyae]MBE1491399.1 hypothetical protein [Plantactinospora soyae]
MRQPQIGRAGLFVTVLSLPDVLDRRVPQPTTVRAGDPATEVAAPAAG